MLKFSKALLLQILIFTGIALLFVWLCKQFALDEMILHMQKTITEMEFWGGILFPFFYAACNVLLLPAGVLSVGSGLCFGLWWGFLIALAGNVLGAAVAFLIGRRLGRQWVEKRLFRYRKWLALDKAIAREGWKIIVLSQVHPLFPTSLLNYIYGITSIRFWHCMVWIALGQAPGLFLYAYMGTLAQLGIRLLKGNTHPVFSEYVIWIGGLLLTLIATTALARLALKLLQEAEKEALSDPENTPQTSL